MELLFTFFFSLLVVEMKDNVKVHRRPDLFFHGSFFVLPIMLLIKRAMFSGFYFLYSKNVHVIKEFK